MYRYRIVPLIVFLFVCAAWQACAAEAVLEHRAGLSYGENNITQRVYFADIWKSAEEKHLYPQDTVVIETEWSEDIASFGTITTFLRCIRPDSKDVVDIPTNQHENGDAGATNTVSWWCAFDADGDDRKDAVFLQVAVQAGYNYDTSRWDFRPTPNAITVFYLGLGRHDVSGEKALELLRKMPLVTGPSPARLEQAQSFWIRVAQGQALLEAKHPEESVKALEPLCAELRRYVQGETPCRATEIAKSNDAHSVGMRECDPRLDIPETSHISFTPTCQQHKNDPPELDKVNVYNPLMIYLTAKEILGRARAEHSG